MYFRLNIGIFHCYVSLPAGKVYPVFLRPISTHFGFEKERNLSPRLVKLRFDFFEAKRRDLLLGR